MFDSALSAPGTRRKILDTRLVGGNAPADITGTLKFNSLPELAGIDRFSDLNKPDEIP